MAPRSCRRPGFTPSVKPGGRARDLAAAFWPKAAPPARLSNPMNSRSRRRWSRADRLAGLLPGTGAREGELHGASTTARHQPKRFRGTSNELANTESQTPTPPPPTSRHAHDLTSHRDPIGRSGLSAHRLHDAKGGPDCFADLVVPDLRSAQLPGSPAEFRNVSLIATGLPAGPAQLWT